jgi:hypothetical protein
VVQEGKADLGWMQYAQGLAPGVHDAALRAGVVLAGPFEVLSEREKANKYMESNTQENEQRTSSVAAALLGIILRDRGFAAGARCGTLRTSRAAAF